MVPSFTDEDTGCERLSDSVSDKARLSVPWPNVLSLDDCHNFMPLPMGFKCVTLRPA